jgi:hypothetical protein
MDFDIQQYLDNLPEDIIIINIANKNLHIIPDLLRFTNLQILICNNNHL